MLDGRVIHSESVKERVNPIVREKRASLPNCNNTAAKATGRKAQYGGMREGAC